MPPEKNVGEPCEGEPHARFDGGQEETSTSRHPPRGARRLLPTRPNLRNFEMTQSHFSAAERTGRSADDRYPPILESVAPSGVLRVRVPPRVSA